MGHLLFYAVYFVALSFLDCPVPVVIMYLAFLKNQIMCCRQRTSILKSLQSLLFLEIDHHNRKYYF